MQRISRAIVLGLLISFSVATSATEKKLEAHIVFQLTQVSKHAACHKYYQEQLGRYSFGANNITRRDVHIFADYMAKHLGIMTAFKMDLIDEGFFEKSNTAHNRGVGAYPETWDTIPDPDNFRSWKINSWNCQDLL